MLRDLFVSLTGHIVVFGGILFSSTLTAGMKPPQMVTVHRITTVTQQQIAQLQMNASVQEERVSKLPQVQIKEDERLPSQTRRKKQALKQTSSPQESLPGKGQKGSPIQGIQTDTQFEYPDYLLEMQNRIFRNWNFPQLRESLTTTVYFRIARDGRIISIKVEKATRNVRFDRSAWEAVQKSNPFPPLPEEFTEKELGVHFNFIFDHI